MLALAVGEKAPSPFWPASVADGAKFEMTVDGDFYVICYLSNISREEAKFHRKKTVKARYLTNDDGSMVLALIRFKGTDQIYELVHDPTVYKPEELQRRCEWWSKTNMVNLLLIDSATGVIRAIRRMNMPEKLWNLWRESWGRALAISDYTQEYYRWVDQLQTLGSTVDLWNGATDAGAFGEKYQL